MNISDLQPISLFILLAGGAGIVYVVRLFIASIATNNERMWQGLREINSQWLEWAERASKASSQSGKEFSDSNKELAREMAAQTIAIQNLTAAINRSIEGGYNLNGAAGLMAEVLRQHSGGNGSSGVKSKNEPER